MFSIVEQEEYIEQERAKVLIGCMQRGETKTRELLRFFTRQERPIVEEWLREKENERQTSFKQEEFKLTKEANDILMKDRNTANFGNKIAIAALFFSFLSFLISLLK